MRTCPKCGFKIENDGAKFCKKCGSPLPTIISVVDNDSIHTTEDDGISSNSQQSVIKSAQADEKSAEKVEDTAESRGKESESIDKQEEAQCKEANNFADVKYANGEDKESQDEVHQYTSEWLKENTNIHGWLSFFIFAIALGGLISAFSSVATYNAEDYAGSIWLGSIDVFLGFGLLAIAIYTIYAFCQRKPNAVFYGRLYVILVFVTNIISVIGSEDAGFSELNQAVRGIIWGTVWFFYLLLSNQVQEIIPKSFRKVNKIDWGILISVIVIPLICFTIGISTINSEVENREQLESEVREVPLADDERTDGKVIFTIPATFECQSEEVEPIADTKLTVFTLQNEAIGKCLLCSDYDNDTSYENLDEYWKNWEGEEDKNLPKTNINRGSKEVNGNKCVYKIVRYNVNGVYVYWRFHVLFDEDSGKCCIVSCYDRNESTDYVNEVLESIRFK